ncbi:MAG: flagellar biosynthetic protein FliO [Acidimicrobiia bacterium]
MADVSMGELLIRSVISLGVVLALVFGAYAIMRRRMSGARPAPRRGGLTASLRSAAAHRSGGSQARSARHTRPARTGLRVVGRATVGRSAVLTAVQFGDRVLLVGAAEQGAPTVLAELDGHDWEHHTNSVHELAISTSTLGDVVSPAADGAGASPHRRVDVGPRGLLDALREATTRRV